LRDSKRVRVETFGQIDFLRRYARHGDGWKTSWSLRRSSFALRLGLGPRFDAMLTLCLWLSFSLSYIKADDRLDAWSITHPSRHEPPENDLLDLVPAPTLRIAPHKLLSYTIPTRRDHHVAEYQRLQTSTAKVHQLKAQVKGRIE
jgi:hypothetical protein